MIVNSYRTDNIRLRTPPYCRIWGTQPCLPVSKIFRNACFRKQTNLEFTAFVYIDEPLVTLIVTRRLLRGMYETNLQFRTYKHFSKHTYWCNVFLWHTFKEITPYLVKILPVIESSSRVGLSGSTSSFKKHKCRSVCIERERITMYLGGFLFSKDELIFYDLCKIILNTYVEPEAHNRWGTARRFSSRSILEVDN